MIALLSERLHTLLRIQRNPSLSRRQVLQFQQRKLRFLIRHAYNRVAYYREVFRNAGVHPDDIRCVGDLQRLPVTTKAMMLERPVEELVSQGTAPSRLICRYTAGSTGEPARIRRTGFEDNLLNLFRARALRTYGRRLSDKTVNVRSGAAPTDKLPVTPNRFLAPLGIMRHSFVDCLRSGNEVARDIAEFAPDVLSGYPGAIAEAAAHWPRGAGGGPSPRLIILAGETATPAMRVRIEKTFGAPMRTVYGCHELNIVAWECPQTGELHVCDDNLILEVLRDGRPVEPGETGEVVITSLHSYTSPYIRYALDDIVTRGAEGCSCGLPFSTIRHLRGRQMDYCTLRDGSRIHHWEILPMSFWDMKWHRRYQFVQEDTSHFVLRILPAGVAPPEELRRLEEQIMAKLGYGARFRFQFVEEIEFTSSGKQRLCISNVDGGSAV